jgi:hypothetical protein
MALARKFRCVNEDYAVRVDVYNNAAGAATFSEGDGFSIVAGTVTALADSNTAGIYGVWCEDVANAAMGAAWVEGIFDVDVDGGGVGINFAINEPVYMASVSTVDTGTKLDVAVGVVVGPEPANGATEVRISIQSQIKNITTHA